MNLITNTNKEMSNATQPHIQVCFICEFLFEFENKPEMNDLISKHTHPYHICGECKELGWTSLSNYSEELGCYNKLTGCNKSHNSFAATKGPQWDDAITLLRESPYYEKGVRKFRIKFDGLGCSPTSSDSDFESWNSDE